MGRTGTLWAYEQTGVMPDAITVAKALGGGPADRRARHRPAPRRRARSPATTARRSPAGPWSRAAALAALDGHSTIRRCSARVRELGERLRAGLERSRTCWRCAGAA